MRGLALAQAWRDRGGRAAFVMASGAEILEPRLGAEGMQLVELTAEPGSAEDAAATAAAAGRTGASCVVVDGYHFDAAYRRTLAEAGLRVVCVDDLGQADLGDADVVLNQNNYAHERLYPRRAASTELLLGPRYALLRREFRRWRGWRRDVRGRPSRVLVTLGGGDADNATLTAIQAVRRLGASDLDVEVIVGPTNRQHPALWREVDDDRRIGLLTNVPDVPVLMAWADIAVTAAGSTSWEMAFMELPMIAVVLAENQAAIARSLEEAGVARNAGWYGVLSPEDLTKTLGALLEDAESRATMAARGRALVDGEGAFRVADRLLALTAQPAGIH